MRYFDRLLENADTDAIPPEVLADALREYGAQASLAGHTDTAEQLTEQSLALFDQLGDEHGRAVMLHRLAILAMWAGDLDRARDLVDESHAIHERHGDRWGIAQTLGAQGAIAREAGDATIAYELLVQSHAVTRAFRGGFADWWASGVVAELACLCLKAGRLDEAQIHAREALSLADQLHYRAGRVFGVGLLATVAAARGDGDRAGRLWRAIEHEDPVAPLGGWRRHRQTCEAVIRQASGADFERDRTAGEGFSLDDAVRLALDAAG
jgi:tetratricopeptide (TPR) repeat protein